MDRINKIFLGSQSLFQKSNKDGMVEVKEKFEEMKIEDDTKIEEEKP